MPNSKKSKLGEVIKQMVKKNDKAKPKKTNQTAKNNFDEKKLPKSFSDGMLDGEKNEVIEPGDVFSEDLKENETLYDLVINAEEERKEDDSIMSNKTEEKNNKEELIGTVNGDVENVSEYFEDSNKTDEKMMIFSQKKLINLNEPVTIILGQNKDSKMLSKFNNELRVLLEQNKSVLINIINIFLEKGTALKFNDIQKGPGLRLMGDVMDLFGKYNIDINDISDLVQVKVIDAVKDFIIGAFNEPENIIENIIKLAGNEDAIKDDILFKVFKSGFLSKSNSLKSEQSSVKYPESKVLLKLRAAFNDLWAGTAAKNTNSEKLKESEVADGIKNKPTENPNEKNDNVVYFNQKTIDGAMDNIVAAGLLF